MATAKAGNEEHVIGLERSYWDAIKKKDGRTVARLTADPCLVVGADGVRELRRDELAEMMKTMPYDLKDYGVEDGHVEVLSIKDDVAIVAYKVRSDYVTEGKPTRTEAFDASVWVRLDGKWVCALHTETPAASKPPEGRVA